MQAILALDQGTTSSRALLFDRQGRVLQVAQKEFKQHYPKPGWVEHDAMEIWQSQIEVAKEVLRKAGMAPSDIASIGITNQRETTVLWDRKTGQPLGTAIVWQDRRTAPRCRQLIADGRGPMIQQRTGLVLDSYFSATKLQWMLDHFPDARRRAQEGELAFGTVDSWLLWKLTGGRVHATDVSNASRTLLVDLTTGQWDDSLLDLFQIPRSVLPEILPSSHLFGTTDAEWFGRPIAIGGVAGDQQAALFGQICHHDGMAKNTYGTGCFMLMHTGDKPRASQRQLLTTIAWKTDGQLEYALEGSVFIAGAIVQWLRDGLGVIQHAREVEQLAREVPDSGGVYVVPALTGLGAPHWDPDARGTILGITRGTTKAHLARACLEGIAYQVADVLGAMEADSGIRVEQLRVDGGAAANDLLMQFQADLLQAPVVRPRVLETTALGAAYLAGLQAGLWKDKQELAECWEAERVFEPLLSADRASELRAQWNRAVERSSGWSLPDA